MVLKIIWFLYIRCSVVLLQLDINEISYKIHTLSMNGCFVRVIRPIIVVIV